MGASLYCTGKLYINTTYMTSMQSTWRCTDVDGLSEHKTCPGGRSFLANHFLFIWLALAVASNCTHGPVWRQNYLVKSVPISSSECSKLPYKTQSLNKVLEKNICLVVLVLSNSLRKHIHSGHIKNPITNLFATASCRWCLSVSQSVSQSWSAAVWLLLILTW